MLLEWKRAVENKGLKINMERTRLKVSSSSEGEPVQSVRHSCAVCGSGVGVNFILWTKCGKWWRERRSGIQQRITAQIAMVYVCPAVPAPMPEVSVTIWDEEIGLVDKFCYLDDMLSCDGGAEGRSGMQQRGRSGGKSVASSPTDMSFSQAEIAYIMPALGQSFYMGQKRVV